MQRNRSFRVSSNGIGPISDKLLRSWWVLSFAGFCLCLHLIAERSHRHQIAQLQGMRNARLRLRDYWHRQERLWFMRALNETNAAWVELVLKRELGVCPANTIKAVFRQAPQRSTKVGENAAP